MFAAFCFFPFFFVRCRTKARNEDIYASQTFVFYLRASRSLKWYCGERMPQLFMQHIIYTARLEEVRKWQKWEKRKRKEKRMWSTRLGAFLQEKRTYFDLTAFWFERKLHSLDAFMLSTLRFEVYTVIHLYMYMKRRHFSLFIHLRFHILYLAVGYYHSFFLFFLFSPFQECNTAKRQPHRHYIIWNYYYYFYGFKLFSINTF